ncbi:CRISPR-associated protein, Csa1 family [Pyrolobus fumarii 1A]|uniref:CRISPR-associated protein, Csa1 family n=1 Tax=Pyrolobus fumarii (strain DSM 11204 / 1A) TaxID=694429 RepID=G0EGJ8_PYRF1|nr:type I-A CRISPR-associated protein Cas4/Csa1 [Pyrolobus fumarii]AEM38372.1 CRISPR-associated protein, Csa1 family [Pyrolobus fumarii 1A]
MPALLAASSLARALRKLHLLRAADPVEERYRGWSWHSSPVKPRYFVGLGVSEVAYRYCPTRRDLWLRRVRGLRGQPTEAMLKGRIVHEAFRLAARDLSRLVLGEGKSTEDAVAELVGGARERASVILESAGIEGDGDGIAVFAARVYKKMVFAWAQWMEETGAPPWITEYEVDGGLLGLSRRLRVDALAPGLVVEVKYGRWSRDYPVALAGYAMALEASLEIPFDYGLVILVNGDGSRLTLEPVYIGNEERAEFLTARDEAAEIVVSQVDPGRPPRCPDQCPMRLVCAP